MILPVCFEENSNTFSGFEEKNAGFKLSFGEIQQVSVGTTLKPATTDTLGGIMVGDNLNITETGVLSVLTTNNAEEDNTRPITSAGAYVIIGNINVLLKTI